MPSIYDIIVIGAGPGGYVAAIRAAQRGARVALIDKNRIGGTCLNRGCIPTKAMVRDAELYHDASSGAFCLESDSPWRVNFAKLMQRKEQVVETLVKGVAHLLNAYRVDVISGAASIPEAGRVRVARADSEDELEARHTIIATGSVPALVPIPGADLPGVLTSDGILALRELPQSLVVVGASVVGMEFACIFQVLGARVSVLGRQTFLREAEQQLAKRLRAMLSQRGMSITIGLEFREITRSADNLLQVHYERQGKPGYAEGEIVLLSTGRWPYTQGLGLERLGMRMNGRAIAVDEYLETNVPGIYAIGDCIGGYMLAHVASYEAEVAVENILGERRAVDYRVVPNCIFTMPEIADVGLTEAEAKEAGLQVQVSRFPFNVNGRALAIGETEGQIRMLCAKSEDGGGQVLGVHIMGPHAGDLIAEAALAMRLGASARDIASTIHAHPTLPEALMEAAMAQDVGAIHYENR